MARRTPAVTATNRPELVESALRTLARLGELSRLADERVVPVEYTQSGLAEFLGVGQGTMSKVLSRLVLAGLIVVSRQHVPGARLRLKTYSISLAGENFLYEVQRRNPHPRPTITEDGLVLL